MNINTDHPTQINKIVNEIANKHEIHLPSWDRNDKIRAFLNELKRSITSINYES